MSDCCGQTGETLAADPRQRRVLIILLGINALMFAVEFGAAWWAESSALLADSGDMLADALVYVVSLLALYRTLRWRAGASLVMAASQFVLGAGVVAQIAHILLASEQPEGALMLVVAAVAALANGAGAMLLLRYRDRDINMRAVWLCTRNDVIGNVATIAAGAAVMAWQTPWPDVVVGGLLAALFIRTAWGVVGEARATLGQAPA